MCIIQEILAVIKQFNIEFTFIVFLISLILAYINYRYTKKMFLITQYPELQINEVGLSVNSHYCIYFKLKNITNAAATNVTINLEIKIGKHKIKKFLKNEDVLGLREHLFKTDNFIQKFLEINKFYAIKELNINNSYPIIPKPSMILSSNILTSPTMKIHLKYRAPLRNSNFISVFKNYEMKFKDSGEEKIFWTIYFYEKDSALLKIKNWIYNIV